MTWVKHIRPFTIAGHPEADAILECDESRLLWQIGVAPLAAFTKWIRYLDADKAEAVRRVRSISEMERLMAVNPPLLFRHSGHWQLLDGAHRLTRCAELGMYGVTVAFATPGLFLGELPSMANPTENTADNLRTCKNCKWWGRDSEGECDNKNRAVVTRSAE